MISEILRVTENISNLISSNVNKYDIARQAEDSEGFEPMLKDGMAKALNGITSLEEVLRVAK